MRHRQYYERAIAKRDYLIEHGEVSGRDEDGARVAVLVSFMPELVQHSNDTRRQFIKQTERVAAFFESQGQDTAVFMRASVDDYRKVLQDRQYGSIVLAGFGNISAIAVPFDRDESSTRYGYIDWLHASALANHVKLGKLVMLQCSGLNRTFNAPWGVGIMSSHRNIFGTVGQPRYATSELPTTPVTDTDVLSYDAIYAQFQPENYSPSPDDGAHVSRVRRTAQSMVNIGLLSEKNLERLRATRHALDPRVMFAQTYLHIPEPIKIPHTGEYDPRTFPQLQ